MNNTIFNSREIEGAKLSLQYAIPQYEKFMAENQVAKESLEKELNKVKNTLDKLNNNEEINNDDIFIIRNEMMTHLRHSSEASNNYMNEFRKFNSLMWDIIEENRANKVM